MNPVPAILIVDDELANFDVLEAMLLPDGYQLHYAANATQTLAFLAAHPPDLILLDVMMPGTDGIELCRQIRAHPPWHFIPIVMVTSLHAKEDLAQCLNAGANDFLSKPVSSVELAARVRSMVRLKHQHDELQHLLQVREDLVQMMVHDLRNPLASIVLSVELLRLTQAVADHGQPRLSQIEVATQQLQLQIDSLLLLAKLEAGKLALHYADIDLCALAQSALANVEAIAAQKHIALVATLPDPGGAIAVDANVCRRLLDNLLSNAIKFSPRDSKVSLTATYTPTGGAIIQIADHGPGVSPALHDRIFEKYEIGTLISGVAQTGLGLAFVKMAIEAHNGTIAVTNNHPCGTTFTLELPGRCNESSP